MGDSLSAVDLGTSKTAIAMGTGERRTCALFEEGEIKCWGYGLWGSLGLGDTMDRGGRPGEMGDNLPTVQLWGP
jgi:hypothetical protein